MSGAKRKDCEFPSNEVIEEHARSIEKPHKEGALVQLDENNRPQHRDNSDEVWAVSKVDGYLVEASDMCVHQGQEHALI